MEAVPYIDLRAQMKSIRAEVDTAIARTLDQCTFCLGPDVAQFEKDFARLCGAQHCLALNSGTSALHLALLLLGLGPGDEVITTPFTFIATCWAITYCGAKPVFVDIDDVTGNLEPRLVEKAITPRTKAIIAVHLYGMPCDLGPLQAICRDHNLALVEDAAQAHGAKYRGKPVGGIGDIGCFSFYPAKNLGAIGEGGALVTNNAEFALRARALREHGSRVRYQHDELGFNYRMEGLQGAVLGVKLKHLPAWHLARRQIAIQYHELLADTTLCLPLEPAYAECAWHLYTIRHPRRDDLKHYLDRHGVGNAVHYPIPVHLQKAYAHLGYEPGDFPIAERAAREVLSLPMFPELTEHQIKLVASRVAEFLNR